jgi:leucyl-tRNA synthetase
MFDYNPKTIEEKWQNFWKENNSFQASDDFSKPKYFVLEMFPYPSGRVHMGHVRNYTIGDVVARFKKACGFNVLHPMGWDAFGLPAENAAIQNNEHPARWTYSNIEAMKKQFLPLGFSYDWGREIATCSEDYYKHEQAMFIDFYNAGLAYQKESIVNWDPVDQTVLANEQVENGRGWRSGALVERKKLKQWFLKITSFAEDLIKDLDTLKNWPEKVVTMQRNWIGKSEGAKVKFKLVGKEEYIEVYTTRPETLFGASYIAIAYDHPATQLNQSGEVKAFIDECSKNAVTEEILETTEKKGIALGISVEHPFDNTKTLPVYVANFVLMDYGTGAVFACPAHDQRDHEFALKYNLPITAVVKPKDEDWDYQNEAYIEDGTLFNSEFLNGLSVEEARKKAINKLEEISLGERRVQYRLRDWGISRQRYWGCPIPIIHCNKCDVVPVPKEQLPVALPEDISFEKTGNPLYHHPTWKHVKCPKCGSDAERETDTFDTFFESSWYFARFCSPKSEKVFDKKQAEYWLPVDQYIGGIEHAVMHLLYARFFTKALKQCGYFDLDEPFDRLLTQGMIGHETYKDKSGKWLYPEEVKKEGNKYLNAITEDEVIVGRSEKMSKSKKNVVDPDYIVSKYGADTARFFLLSDSPPERDLEWTDAGVEGSYKYLSKLHKSVIDVKDVTEIEDHEPTLKVVHKTIKDVTELLDTFHFNKAIARIRELTNYLYSSELEKGIVKNGLKVVARLLNPITPHLSEELWQALGGEEALINILWPSANDKFLVEENAIIAVQLNGKMRGTIEVKVNASEAEVLAEAKLLGNVQALMGGKEIKKVIYVPNKIINIISG